MAKRGSPLGFSYFPSKVEGYFAFISGATTVSGLFLAIFGLTAFGYMLTGDPNVNMYTVLQGLSQLPNPLEFIRDCNQIMVALANMLSKLSANVTDSNMPDIFKAVLGIFFAITRLVGYVFTFLVSALLLPFYLFWFSFRCAGTLFYAIGLRELAPSIALYEWQPVSWLLGVIGGI